MKGPHFAPRAKRVIQLFMDGGPSHVDTFDPKPLLTKHHGQMLPNPNPRTENETGAAFGSPFKFARQGECGLPVSELFPHLAGVADELCVVRSMVSDQPFHDQAMLMMLCGDNRLVRPSVGAWLTYGLGSENHDLPGFVAMCPRQYPGPGPQHWRSAFLPNEFQGAYINSGSARVERIIENIKNSRMSLAEQRIQLDFQQELNRIHLAHRVGDDRLEARIKSHEQAFRMQLAASGAFDIRREPHHIRKLYGDGVQGRQMLLARRLVERGVRFLQVWYGPGNDWDSHSQLAAEHRELAQQCDQATAALIIDLKQRGLLDETLVIWGGEFGRTPTVEMGGDGVGTGDYSKLGRDHNPYGFSIWLAGGGVKAGYTYGATDEFGFHAVENPMHVHDLHATVLHLMGLDHERLTFRYAGRDFRLTDVHGKVAHDIIA